MNDVEDKITYTFHVGDEVSIAYKDEDDEDYKYYLDRDNENDISVLENNYKDLSRLKFKEYATAHDMALHGKIKSLKGPIAVVRSVNGYSSNYEDKKVLLKYLVPTEVFNKKFALIENEYEELSDSLSGKINEAALLIEQAQKLANENGYDLSQLPIGNVLYNAMDSSGWRMSSIGC